MAQLDLAVRAGERQRAGDGSPVVVLLHQPVRVFFGSANPVMKATRAVPPGGRRTNWRSATIGSRTGPVVFDSGPSVASAIGSLYRPAATDETRAIGLELRRRADASTAAEQVKEVGPRAARARTARADQRVMLRDADVSMNKFENAGCARSASGGASTTSA